MKGGPGSSFSCFISHLTACLCWSALAWRTPPVSVASVVATISVEKLDNDCSRKTWEGERNLKPSHPSNFSNFSASPPATHRLRAHGSKPPSGPPGFLFLFYFLEPAVPPAALVSPGQAVWERASSPLVGRATPRLRGPLDSAPLRVPFDSQLCRSRAVCPQHVTSLLSVPQPPSSVDWG